jgi:hypothetical protein
MNVRRHPDQPRNYLQKGQVVVDCGHVVDLESLRMWVRFEDDDGYERWVAALSSSHSRVRKER